MTNFESKAAMATDLLKSAVTPEEINKANVATGRYRRGGTDFQKTR